MSRKPRNQGIKNVPYNIFLKKRCTIVNRKM